jgi:protein phosphatase-4 regulatory subunit 3
VAAFLNDAALQQQLFSPENILTVIGTFECALTAARAGLCADGRGTDDPEMKQHSVKHREYLESGARFRQVVPFSSAVADRAHHNFRLQYLKDVVLPRMIDDPVRARGRAVTAG